MNASTVLSEVPGLLKAIPNWVSWKAVNKDGKDTKEPFIPGTSNHASSTDPATWTDFQTAVSCTRIDETQGVGFVIHGKATETGIVGFDLDGCRNQKTGELAPWADKIVDCLESYTEITPSKTGVRIWVIGKLPGDERVFNLDPSIGVGNKVKIEVFDRARYFTVTGDAIFEGSCPIETRDLTEVYKMCQSLKVQFPAKTSHTSQTSLNTADSSSESTKINRTGSVITSKLELLMHGKISASNPFVIEDAFGNSLEYPSHSEADLALCTLLAIKHGNNADAIYNDYAASSLFREKWGNREADFRKLTISKAIARAEHHLGETSIANAPNPKASQIPLWDRATPFSDIPDTPMEWILPGLIVKGETTMMTGDFGSFKSYMTYFIADAISQGGVFVNRAAQKHPVLVLDRENSKGTISLRRYLVGNLRNANNVRLLGRFTSTPAPAISDPELTSLCRTVQPFIIIDSMQDFHPGKKENDTDDMTEFAQEVNSLIDAGAVAVLIIHHVPKAGRGKSGKYRGATAIPGGVGGALFVEKIARLGVKIEGFKTRDGEDSMIELLLRFPSELEMKAKTGRVSYSIVRSGLDRNSELREAIVSHVALNGPSSGNSIAKSIGGDRNEIYAAIKILKDEKRLLDGKDGIRIAGAVTECPNGVNLDHSATAQAV